MTETAYSTDNPEIVAAYRDACAARRDHARRIVDAVRDLGADHERILGTGDGISAPTITGLTPLRRPDTVVPNNDEDYEGAVHLTNYVIPDGWRIVRERLEPRRGKPGQAAREWLAQHQPVDVRGVMSTHGLPRAAWIPRRGDFGYTVSAPNLFEHDGTLWACYAGEPGAGEMDRGETCTWTPRKLSEYHAAKEAHEDAAARGKADA